MKQNVKFVYDSEEIEAKIEWEDDGKEFDVNFFDSQTGYTGSSDPGASQGKWYYQNADDQEKLMSLINAVREWGNNDDWTQYLTWEDGAEDVFEFEWDGVSRLGYEGEYRELTRK